ncbi:MAG: hypothetical protein M1492_08350 [Gammaproteobacteria bacterium]|jgi:hypothetical protein|nr:hypothetical protein [Gammaproteobacteria bacterium]
MCDYEGHDFGANYLDSCCIDGYLWDLDSCDEPGGPLTAGGDLPCPKCNTLEYLENAKEVAESCVHGRSNDVLYTGERVWLGAVKKAEIANPEGTAVALRSIGVVCTLVPDPGEKGYAVHRYIPGAQG